MPNGRLIMNYSGFLFEERASAILYKFLMSSRFAKAFLLPANICPIVPTTFMKAKVPYEFVDIDPITLCVDEAIVLDKVKNGKMRYSGLLFNHTYGVDYVPEKLFTEMKLIDPKLLIIDDRCSCAPAIDEEGTNNALVDLVLYSTGHAKYLDLGFGGFAFLKRGHRYKQGIEVKYAPSDLSELVRAHKAGLQSSAAFNYRDTNWLNCKKPGMSAAEYLSLASEKLCDVLTHKRQLNAIYTESIAKDFQCDPKFNNWRFNIRLSNKNETLAKIFGQGLFASSLFHSLGEGVFANDHFPNAVSIHAQTINLFNDLYFNEDQAIRICGLINAVGR